MEIIFTTLIALLAGILIGALIAHNKSQALRTRAKKNRHRPPPRRGNAR